MPPVTSLYLSAHDSQGDTPVYTRENLTGLRSTSVKGMSNGLTHGQAEAGAETLRRWKWRLGRRRSHDRCWWRRGCGDAWRRRCARRIPSKDRIATPEKALNMQLMDILELRSNEGRKIRNIFSVHPRSKQSRGRARHAHASRVRMPVCNSCSPQAS